MERELIELIRELKELQQEIKLTHETVTTLNQRIIQNSNRRKLLTD